MKKILAGLAVWSVSSVVFATSITHGAYVFVESGGYSRGNPHVNNYYAYGMGGVGETLVDQRGGSRTQAYASLLPSGGMPELKVYASDRYTSDAFTFAQGFQRYKYQGENEVTLTVNGSFHTTLSNLETGHFTGAVGLWSVSAAEDFLTYTFGDGSESLYANEYVSGTGSSYAEADIESGDGEYNLSATASLNLVNGDEFYLYGSLTAFTIDGDIDALNTGTFAFDFAGAGIDSSDLITVGDVAAVPVPAAVWLMGSAMLGLFGFKRKS